MHYHYDVCTVELINVKLNENCSSNDPSPKVASTDLSISLYIGGKKTIYIMVLHACIHCKETHISMQYSKERVVIDSEECFFNSFQNSCMDAGLAYYIPWWS